MLTGVIAVQVHLPGVGVGQLTELEVDDHEAAQPAVEEDEVHAVPRVADPETPLAADEGKLWSQLEQERLQPPDQRLLQLGFGVLVLEVEELQQVGVLDRLRGRNLSL